MIKKVTNFFTPYSIILINHLIGIVGLQISYTQDVFVQLTPINLWITAFILIYTEKKKDSLFWLFAVITFIFGMSIEIIGVKTGSVFGEYFYSNILGFQILEVPIIIGVNWFILLYSSISLVNEVFIKLNVLAKAFLASLLMIFIDFFIEPFAVYFNLWQWTAVDIPIQNYAAWFVISFIILMLFAKKINDFRNRTASITYVILFAFFIANYFLNS